MKSNAKADKRGHARINICTVLVDVEAELRRATELHAPQNSAHESYAVILEEVDEFWNEVKKKREQRDQAKMRSELIQIAAMACRAILDLDLAILDTDQ